jgi:hypothetical protein
MSGLGRRSRVCTLINFSYLSVVLLVRSKGELRYSHGPTFDGWSVRESRYQVERADRYGCVGGHVIKSLYKGSRLQWEVETWNYTRPRPLAVTLFSPTILKTKRPMHLWRSAAPCVLLRSGTT